MPRVDEAWTLGTFAGNGDPRSSREGVMDLGQLKRHWNAFGKTDPLWAIIALPDKKGNKWDMDEFFDRGEAEIGSVMAYARQLPVSFRSRRALDFGCGVGRLTQALTARFDELVGVDVAPSMIRLARRYNRHGRRCRYVVNGEDNLRLFPSDHFDFVYSNMVLQHMRPAYAKAYI